MKAISAGKSFSIFTLMRTLARRKLYLVLPVVLMTSAAYLYVHRLPERFKTRALVAAEAPPPGVLTGKTAPAVNVQDELRNIRENVLSQPVLEDVIREFDLYDLSTPENTASAIAAMKSRVEIQVEAPDAFYIGFEGASKDQVMQVANRLAGRFIARTGALHGQREAHQDTFLDTEVARLRGQLNQQEESLRAYRQSVAGQLPEFVASNLKQIDSLQQEIQAKTDQITETEARRATATEELKALDKARVLEDEPAAPTPAEIALADLRSKLKQLRARYTPEYPEIKQTEKQVQDLEANVAAAAAKAPRRQPSQIQLQYLSLQAELKSIEPRLATYKQQKDALTSRMHDYEHKVDSSPGYDSLLAGRTRDVAVTRGRYEDLMAKQQEAKLSQRAEQTDSSDSAVFRMAEPAPLPSAPYSPKRLLIVMLGLLAGLGTGIAAIFVVEQTNDTFATSEDFEDAHDIPVLASVPSIPKAGKPPQREKISPISSLPGDRASGEEIDRSQHCLPILNDPQSVAAQQYNILALKVRRWMEHSGARMVAVTSAAGEEGKSVTALNLSLALAASMEEPVLLVDCDMRLPQVNQRLGLKVEKGLSDLLASPESDVHSYISKVGSLDVITGGSPPVNPVGLLASRRAREIFDRLREEYRLVVLDSPPIVPIADTHILTGLSDAVVLVVRARKTRPALFQRAVESLDAPNVIGVVLNDVEYADTPYAYAYRYYQQRYLGRG